VNTRNDAASTSKTTRKRADTANDDEPAPKKKTTKPVADAAATNLSLTVLVNNLWRAKLKHTRYAAAQRKFQDSISKKKRKLAEAHLATSKLQQQLNAQKNSEYVCVY
jgi:hypothetical protein